MKYIIYICLFLVFLTHNVNAVEMIIGGGKGINGDEKKEDIADIAKIGLQFSILDWLNVTPYFLLFKRDEVHDVYGLDLELGWNKLEPLIMIDFGISYWNKETKRLGTPFEYHVGFVLGLQNLLFGVSHYSNAGGRPFGNCNCTNDGENIIMLLYREKF